MDTPNTSEKPKQPSTIVMVVIAITSSQGITAEMKEQSAWLRRLVAGITAGVGCGV